MSIMSKGQARYYLLFFPLHSFFSCALAELLRLFDGLLKMINVRNMMEHLVFLTALSDLHTAPLPSSSPRPVITINNNSPRAILLFINLPKPAAAWRPLGLVPVLSVARSLARTGCSFFFFHHVLPFFGLAWRSHSTSVPVVSSSFCRTWIRAGLCPVTLLFFSFSPFVVLLI